MAADRHAQRFRGLPPGVTRWMLMRNLRNAAATLGVTARELHLLETFIEHSYDADWANGAEPIIITPVIELAEILGVSERQIRNLENSLMRRGLLTFRDCGNHARRGRRCRRTGRLLHGYGPSLAPLAARAAEIAELAATARVERADNRRLRLAIGALRRRLKADIDAMKAHAPDMAESLSFRLGALPCRLPAHTRIETLDALRTRLATLAAEARATLGDPAAELEASGETSARAEPECAPLNPKQEQDAPKEQRASAHKGRYFAVGEAAPQRVRPHPVGPSREHGIDLSTLIGASSKRFVEAMNSEHYGWANFIDAARAVGLLLGISQQLWGDACGTLGRQDAAVAVWLTDLRIDGEAPFAIRDPSAYMRGMLAAARENRLNLAASVATALGRSVKVVAPPQKITECARCVPGKRLPTADIRG